MSFADIAQNTLEIRCAWSSRRRPWPAHGTNGWRSLPYLVVLVPFTGHYLLRFAGETTDRRCRSGHALVVPPQLSHRIEYPTPGELTGAHLSATVAAGVDITTFITVPPLLPPSHGRKLAKAMDAMARYSEPGNDPLVAATRIQESAAAVLAIILECADAKPDAQKRLLLIERFRPIFGRLTDDDALPLSVETLARLCGLSRSRFTLLFTEAFRTSPRSWLIRRRIDLAKRRLFDPSRTLASIAEELGYCDAFHLSRQFTSQVGSSPSRYRQKIFEMEPDRGSE
jgi:AraC-like DNA-binding protein